MMQAIRQTSAFLPNTWRLPVSQRTLLVKRAVLIAEASDGCYFMLQRAFAAAKLPHMLRRVRDGGEALAYVLGREKFCDRQHFPFPDLIIAERALPKIGGIEVLRYLRYDLCLQMPAVIFSASLVAPDMRSVVELGRADYFLRPIVFSVLLELVQSIQQSWLQGP